MDRYPLSAYALDYHVDVGVTHPDGVPAMIAQWAAAQLWSATQLPRDTVRSTCSPGRSRSTCSAAPTARSARSARPSRTSTRTCIGQAWMVVAILLAGLWGIWKALVQRRYTETAGALATSVVCVLIALFFVYEPQQTIGQASQMDQHDLARLPLRRQPGLARPPRGRQAPGLRPALPDARLRPVGRARVRRPLALRRHPQARRRRLPHTRRTRTTRPPTSAATTSRSATTATAATRRGSCASRPARTRATPNTTRCAPARRRRRRSSAATRSTRPTRPRSTRSRRAAPSSA